MLPTRITLQHKVATAMLLMRRIQSPPNNIPNFSLVQLFLSSANIKFLFLTEAGFSLTFQEGASIAIRLLPNVYGADYPEDSIAYFTGKSDLLFGEFMEFTRRHHMGSSILAVFQRVFTVIGIEDRLIEEYEERESFSEQRLFLRQLREAMLENQLARPLLEMNFDSTSLSRAQNLLKVEMNAQLILKSASFRFFAAIMEELQHLLWAQSFLNDNVENTVTDDGSISEKTGFMQIRLKQRIEFYQRLINLLNKPVVMLLQEYGNAISSKRIKMQVVVTVATICAMLVKRFKMQDNLTQDEILLEKEILSQIIDKVVIDVLSIGVNLGGTADEALRNCALTHAKQLFIQHFWERISEVDLFSNNAILSDHLEHVKDVMAFLEIMLRLQTFSQLLAEENQMFSFETKEVTTSLLAESEQMLNFSDLNLSCYIAEDISKLVRANELAEKLDVVLPHNCTDAQRYHRVIATFVLNISRFKKKFGELEIQFASLLAEDVEKLPNKTLLHYFGEICSLFENRLIKVQFAYFLDSLLRDAVEMLKIPLRSLEQIEYLEYELLEVHLQLTNISPQWFLEIFELEQFSGNEKTFMSNLAVVLDEKYREERDLELECIFPNIATFIIQFEVFKKESERIKRELISEIERDFEESAKDSLETFSESIFEKIDDKTVEFRSLTTTFTLIDRFTRYLVYQKMELQGDFVTAYGTLLFRTPEVCLELNNVIERHNILFNYKELQFIYQSRLNTKIDNLGELALENQHLNWQQDLELKELSNESAFLLSNSLMNNELFFEVIGECHTLIDLFYENETLSSDALLEYETDDLELCKVLQDIMRRYETFLEFPMDNLALEVEECYNIGSHLPHIKQHPEAGFKRKEDSQMLNKTTFKAFEHSLVKAKNYVNELMYNVENKIICSLAEINEEFYDQMENELEVLIERLRHLIDDVQTRLLGLLLLFGTKFTTPIFSISIGYNDGITSQPKIYSLQDAVSVISNGITDIVHEEKVDIGTLQAKLKEWADLLLDLEYFDKQINAQDMELTSNIGSPYLRIVMWINAIFNLSVGLHEFMESIEQQFELKLSHPPANTCECAMSFEICELHFNPILSRTNEMLLLKIKEVFDVTDEFVAELLCRFQRFDERICSLEGIECDLDSIFQVTVKELQGTSDNYEVIERLTALYSAVKDDRMLHGFFIEYDEFLAEMRDYEYNINNIHLGFSAVNASELLQHHQALMYGIVQKTTEPIVRYLEENLKKSFCTFEDQFETTEQIVRECTTQSSESLTNYQRIAELLKNRFILKCCLLTFQQINGKCIEMSKYLTHRNILIHTSIEQLQENIVQADVHAEALLDDIDELINNTRQVHLQYEHEEYSELQQKSLLLCQKCNEVSINAVDLINMLPENGRASSLLSARISALTYFADEQEAIKEELLGYYELLYLEGLTLRSLTENIFYFNHNNLEEFVNDEYLNCWHKKIVDIQILKVELYQMLYTLIEEYDNLLYSPLEDFYKGFTRLFESSKSLQRNVYEMESKIHDLPLRNDIMETKELISGVFYIIFDLQKYENLKPFHWLEIVQLVKPEIINLQKQSVAYIERLKENSIEMTAADVIKLEIRQSGELNEIITGADLEQQFDRRFIDLSGELVELNTFSNLTELLKSLGKIRKITQFAHLENGECAEYILISNLVHADFESICLLIETSGITLPAGFSKFLAVINELRDMFQANFDFCIEFNYQQQLKHYIEAFTAICLICGIFQANWVILHILFVLAFDGNYVPGLLLEDYQKLTTNCLSTMKALVREECKFGCTIDSITMQILNLETKEHTLFSEIISIIKNGLVAETVDAIYENEYTMCLEPIFQDLSRLTDADIFNYFSQQTNLFTLKVEELTNEEFVTELATVLEAETYNGDNFMLFLNKYSSGLSLFSRVPETEDQETDMSRFVEYLQSIKISRFYPFICEIVVNYNTVIGVIFASERQYADLYEVSAEITPLYRTMNTKEAVHIPTALFPFKSGHPVLQLLVQFILLLEETLCVYTTQCVKSLRQLASISTHYESAFSPNLQNQTEFPLKLFLYSACEKWEATYYPEELLSLAMHIMCDSALALPHDIFEDNDYELIGPVAYCSYFKEQLMAFQDTLKEFLAGYIEIKAGDTKSIVKKVFQIPHVYSKVKLLVNIANEYMRIICPIIEEKSQFNKVITREDCTIIFPQRGYMMFYSESIARDDLPYRYLVDDVVWPEKAFNPEQVVIINGPKYLYNTILFYLTKNEIHAYTRDEISILDEFAGNQFVEMLNSLHINPCSINQLVNSANSFAVDVYRFLLSNVEEFAKIVFAPGYSTVTINDEDVIRLGDARSVLPKYELLNIKFLDQLSFLIFTQTQPELHSKSSYRHSQSVNYTSTFLSQSRNNEVTNEIFGAPENEKRADNSDLDDSMTEEHTDYSISFVFSDIGWEELNQGSNFSSILFPAKPTDLQIAEEFDHLEVSIIDTVVSYIYVSTFYFAVDDAFHSNFYNYDFMQLRFCKKVIEYLQGNIKIGEEFMYNEFGEEVYQLLQTKSPFESWSNGNERSQQSCISETFIQNAVRDEFLNYSFQTYQISIGEISRVVYEFAMQFILMTLNGPSVIEIKVAPIVYLEVFLNVIYQVFEQRGGVQIKELERFSANGLSNSENLNVQIVNYLGTNELLEILRKQPLHLFVIVVSLEDLPIPCIEILGQTRFVHNRLVEHYISMELGRLLAETKVEFKGLINCGEAHVKIEHTCFSAEKLRIQETLSRRLARLSYFDRYYITSAANTLCECATDTVIQFLEEIYKTEQLEYDEILGVEESICEQLVRMSHAVLMVIYNAIGNRIPRVEFKFWEALVVFICYYVARSVNVNIKLTECPVELSQDETFLPTIIAAKSIRGSTTFQTTSQWDYYTSRVVGDGLMYKLESDIQIDKFFPILEIEDNKCSTKYIDTSKSSENDKNPEHIMEVLKLYTYHEFIISAEKSEEFTSFLLSLPEIRSYGLRCGMRQYLARQFISGNIEFADNKEKFSILRVKQWTSSTQRRFIHTSYNEMQNYHTDQLVICNDELKSSSEHCNEPSGSGEYVIRLVETESSKSSHLEHIATEQFDIVCAEIVQHFYYEPFYENVVHLLEELKKLALTMAHNLHTIPELCFIVLLIVVVENVVEDGVIHFIQQQQQYFREILYRQKAAEKIDKMLLAAKDNLLVLPFWTTFTRVTLTSEYDRFCLNYSENSSFLISKGSTEYTYAFVNDFLENIEEQVLFFSETTPDNFEIQKLLYYLQIRESLEIINARVDTLDCLECAVMANNGRLVVYSGQNIADFYIHLCKVALKFKEDVYIAILQLQDVPADFLSDVLCYNYPMSIFSDENINRDVELFKMFEEFMGVSGQMSIPTLLSAQIQQNTSVLDLLHFIVLNPGNEPRPEALQVNGNKLKDAKCRPIIPASEIRTIRNADEFINNIRENLEKHFKDKIEYLAEILQIHELLALRIKQEETEGICAAQGVLETQQLHANEKERAIKEQKLLALQKEIALNETELNTIEDKITEKISFVNYHLMMSEQAEKFGLETYENLLLLSRSRVQYADEMDTRLQNVIKRLLPNKEVSNNRGEGLDKVIKQLMQELSEISQEEITFLIEALHLQMPSENSFFEPDEQFVSSAASKFEESPVDYNTYMLLDLTVQKVQHLVKMKLCERETAKLRQEMQSIKQQIVELETAAKEYSITIQELTQHIHEEERQMVETKELQTEQQYHLQNLYEIERIYEQLATNALFCEQKVEANKAKLEYQALHFANYVQTHDPLNSKMQLFLEQKFGKVDEHDKNFFLPFAKEYFSIEALIVVFRCNVQYKQHTNKLAITKNDILVTQDKLIFMLDDNLNNDEYFSQLFGLFDNSFFSLEDALADNIIMSLDENLTLLSLKIQNENQSIAIDADNEKIGEYLARMLENPRTPLTDSTHVEDIRIAETHEELRSHMCSSSHNENIVIIVRGIDYEVVEPIMHGRQFGLRYRFGYITDDELNTKYDEITASEPIKLIFEAPSDNIQDPYIGKYKIRKVEEENANEDYNQTHIVGERTICLLTSFIDEYQKCKRLFNCVLEEIKSNSDYIAVIAKYQLYKAALNKLLAAAIQYKKYVVQNIQ